jgi:hypothetical protein
MKKIILFFTFIVVVRSIYGTPQPFTLFNLTKGGLNVYHKGEVVYIPPNSYEKFMTGIKATLKNTTGGACIIKMKPGKTLIINN